MAKMAPVAGALKMAATPPGAGHHEHLHVCRVQPPPKAPLQAGPDRRPHVDRRALETQTFPNPKVAAAAATRPSTGRRSSGRSGSWKFLMLMYSSAVAGVAPPASHRNAAAAEAKPQTGATACNPIGSV